MNRFNRNIDVELYLLGEGQLLSDKSKTALRVLHTLGADFINKIGEKEQLLEPTLTLKVIEAKQSEQHLDALVDYYTVVGLSTLDIDTYLSDDLCEPDVRWLVLNLFEQVLVSDLAFANVETSIALISQLGQREEEPVKEPPMTRALGGMKKQLIRVAEPATAQAQAVENTNEILKLLLPTGRLYVTRYSIENVIGRYLTVEDYGEIAAIVKLTMSKENTLVYLATNPSIVKYINSIIDKANEHAMEFADSERYNRVLKEMEDVRAKLNSGTH